MSKNILRDPKKEDGLLGMELVGKIEKATWERSGKKAYVNIKKNQKYLEQGKSIEILNFKKEKLNSAVIIAAGPSIKRHDPLKEIKKNKFKGLVVSTDSGLNYCLANDVVPDLIVTVDPNETRIVRWFGDPSLNEKKMNEDDYFRRQELDDDFYNEYEANKKLINLVNKSCRNMKIALSTSSSASVVERVMEVGMDIFWWNPMLDDPSQENSYTNKIYKENSLPCINSGGNVGAAIWMILDAIIGVKNIALTGFDFSYYNDSDYYHTQSYHHAVDLVGKKNLHKLGKKTKI